MSEGRPEVEAVLWDADGVLQHGRRTWQDLLTEIGGPGFADKLFAAEVPALRGEEPLRDCVVRLLQEHGITRDPAPVLALWEDVEVDEQAFDLIAAVRSSGTRCYLATNQQDVRVRYMRENLGYDRHFDGTYYSSEMGAMKPEAAYFERIVADLGLAPEVLLFIDDNPANIATARELGLQVHHHDPQSGTAGLRRALDEAGVAA